MISKITACSLPPEHLLVPPLDFCSLLRERGISVGHIIIVCRLLRGLPLSKACVQLRGLGLSI